MGTQYKGTDEEKLALDAFIKLNRASESVLASTKRVYSKAGLTETQFAALELLYHLGPQTQLSIGKKVLKSRGNITMVIGNLEKDGYIMREKDADDRRCYSVNLTKRGHDLVAQIFPGHAGEVVRAMKALSRGEQVELGRLCRKLGLAQG